MTEQEKRGEFACGCKKIQPKATREEFAAMHETFIAATKAAEAARAGK